MQTSGLLEELLVTWGDLHKCLLLVVEFPSNVIIICDFHPVAGRGFVWHHNKSNDQAETQEQAEKEESWDFPDHLPLELSLKMMIYVQRDLHTSPPQSFLFPSALILVRAPPKPPPGEPLTWPTSS